MTEVQATQSIIAYHMTCASGFDAFKIAKDDVGIHFGTRNQALDRLRWKEINGYPRGNPALIEARLDLNNPLRLEDYGEWTPSRLAEELVNLEVIDFDDAGTRPRQATIRKLLHSRGHDGIVYRNVGEALGLAEAFIEEQRLRKELSHHERMSEDWKAAQAIFMAAAHKLNTIRESAEDSYIVLSPDQITILSTEIME